MASNHPSREMTALVTGTSRGIGSVIAAQLAARGVRVAAHYRNRRTDVEAVLASLPGEGHVAFAADLADPAAVTGLWREVAARMDAAWAVGRPRPQHPCLRRLTGWQRFPAGG